MALRKTHLRISQSDLGALLRSDFVEIYNPFKDYFENLTEWFSGIDYIAQLAEYVVTDDKNRFYYHLKKMLVRTVACALKDDVFNKQAFVLVGYSQNSGKSTFCRFLCPPELDKYFTETFSADKDGLISLAENLFINLDELASLSKYDINQLKSAFSKDKIKIRRPFEKRATTSPRRASFLGSTNKAEFLTDETGSVRWLCFEVLEIDWRYKKEIEINDVWAQAYTLYKSGFSYNLTTEDIRENDKNNRKFQVVSGEAEKISQMFEPGTEKENDGFKTAFEIATQLNLDFAGTYKFTPERVGKALTFLGFKRIIKRINGSNPVHGYYFITKNDKEPATLATNDDNKLPF